MIGRRWLHYCFAISLCVSGLPTAVSHGQSADEYQLKAAFLYSFTKFVEWPAEVFSGPADPIRICTLGAEAYGLILEKVVQGKTVGARPLSSRTITRPGEARTCHVLFVPQSERKRLKDILASVQATGVLTVGESDDFLRSGGIVNFKLVSGRIGLEINIDSAEREKLRISSKLLSLSHIVRSAN